MSPKIANTAYARSLMLIKITAAALIMLIVLLVMVSNSQASVLVNYRQTEVLAASENEAEDGADLGHAVAASGDTIAVGAPDAGGGTGQVLVYVRPTAGWAGVTATETATLTLPAAEASTDDLFGTAVAISGDTIVVGAPGSNSFEGAAYVYVRPESGWSPTSSYVASLTHPSAVIFDYFGESVAISGDTIVVGAPTAGTVGKAFIFERPSTGWEPTVASVELSNAAAGADEEEFGAAVATHADTVVVGAPSADVGATDDQGAAYVFEKAGSSWTSTGTPTKILTRSLETNDYFGGSVDIREDGKVIVVGANASPPASNQANGQGAAYIFTRPDETWASTGDLISDTLGSGAPGNSSLRYGNSVSISGDTIVVGAPEYRTDVGGDDLKTGAAFIYVQPNVDVAVDPEDAWVSTDVADEVLNDETGRAEDDLYGEAVAVFGGTVVVGVPGDDLPADDGAANQGSARVFENLACSAQSGDWDDVSTWVDEDNIPNENSNVCISTGHVVTVNSDKEVNRLLVNPGAELQLPGTGVMVFEQVINHGTLVQQKTYSGGSGWMQMLRIDATGSGPTIFLGGDISSTAELGDVALTLRTTIDWFSPTAEYGFCTANGSDSPSYTARCFDIEPTVTDQAADIRLWILNDELKDIPVEDLVLYRFAGSDWQQLESEVDVVDYTSIGYHNVTAATPGFSDFLVGSQDLIPTAVTLVNFTVNDALDNSIVVGTLLALTVIGSLALLFVARRRRVQEKQP